MEFDSAKNTENGKRHSVSRGFASQLDWDAALIWVDTRFEYERVRMIALASEISTLYYVAFLKRDDVRRIISLRGAERRSVRHSPEVIGFFKSTGEGWQSHMDGVLQEHVLRQIKSASR